MDLKLSHKLAFSCHLISWVERSKALKTQNKNQTGEKGKKKCEFYTERPQATECHTIC